MSECVTILFHAFGIRRPNGRLTRVSLAPETNRQSVSQSLDDHRREKKAEEINRVLKMRRHNKFVSHCLLLSALVPLIHGYSIDKSSNEENEEENEFLGCGGYQRHHMKITPV